MDIHACDIPLYITDQFMWETRSKAQIIFVNQLDAWIQASLQNILKDSLCKVTKLSSKS